jgi:hypothetical protein
LYKSAPAARDAPGQANPKEVDVDSVFNTAGIGFAELGRLTVGSGNRAVAYKDLPTEELERLRAEGIAPVVIAQILADRMSAKHRGDQHRGGLMSLTNCFYVALFLVGVLAGLAVEGRLS